MAVLPIVLYPDPVLLTPTSPVTEVDDDVRRLVGDMVDTMYAAPGIGLAANQVGVSQRICVVDLEVGEVEGTLKVLINPVVTATEGSDVAEEGCLSFPDINIDVERALRVTVAALDLDGCPFEMEAEGLLARAILHECEHLDGHVFLRNLSSLKRDLIVRQIKKRIKAGDWLAAVPG